MKQNQFYFSPAFHIHSLKRGGQDEKRKERSNSGGASGENPRDPVESWTGF
ncbi:hypothetical protein comes_10240 [Coprococcus comes]|uniref:Uncharacterized protein n=1 Tax=Coprococcus comes TaxID=410072 RepID=A0AA37QAP7_9FIRM|nr:hypothetical protein comes_10240 [Coprococcus comes]